MNKVSVRSGDVLKLPNYDHVIDWDKVKNIKDVTEILKGLEMRYDISQCNEKVKSFLIKAEC